MSPLDPPVPPVGEEIHLPGPSLQPVLLAFGITLALLGITMGKFIAIAGLILSVWVTIRWIVDTRRDINALPEDHDAH
jgi:hypothetical protein